MRRHSFNFTLRILILALFLGLGNTLANHRLRSENLVPLKVRSVDGPVRRDGYIVTFKPSVDAHEAHDQIVNEFGIAAVRHTYNTSSLDGLAGTFNASQLHALQTSEFVESIELDSVGQVDSLVQQTDATWGLSRISQLGPLSSDSDVTGLDYTYSFDESGGSGSDIYIIDSGINIQHIDFGGRATWGKTFGGYTPDIDGLGHGTHVAGIAGGTRYGVAKRANLIAVRILSATGSGFSSDCIAAVDWVISQAKATGRPSIINISIKFPPNDVLDAIVTDAVNAGVHVIVSAGNAASDASTQSPGRAAAATTVGATDITDSVTSYSNYGPLVDLFAPGTGITSAYNTSNTATKVDSGTSMSAPFVAGVTAYFIGLYGNKSPLDILNLIKSVSPYNKLGALPDDTINQIVDNGAFLLPGYQQSEIVDGVTRSVVNSASVDTISSSTGSSSVTSFSENTIPSTSTSTTIVFVTTMPKATTITPLPIPSALSSSRGFTSAKRSRPKWCRYWWCARS